MKGFLIFAILCFAVVHGRYSREINFEDEEDNFYNMIEKQEESFPRVYGYQDGDKCPAQRFYDDCNICACSKDGYSAACTRKACPPGT